MKYQLNKWYPYDHSKQAKQKLPPVNKYVLLYFPRLSVETCGCYVAGYFRNPGGVKSDIGFVRPGVCRGIQPPIMWNDCLPDDTIIIPFPDEKI